jgi:hypothetical protein
MSGKVQEVYTRENNEEPAQQRNGVDRIRRIESLEENKGSAQGGRSKSHIIKRIDAGKACQLQCCCYRANLLTLR